MLPIADTNTQTSEVAIGDIDGKTYVPAAQIRSASLFRP